MVSDSWKQGKWAFHPHICPDKTVGAKPSANKVVSSLVPASPGQSLTSEIQLKMVIISFWAGCAKKQKWIRR